MGAGLSALDRAPPGCRALAGGLVRGAGWLRRGAVQVLREGRDGRALEELDHRHVTAGALREECAHLREQQRVAAEVEEVVVAPDPVDAEHLAPDVDDPRLDPIWAKCGQLGAPVLIHTADPRSFWDPMDRYNERWLELKLHPGRRRSETNPVSWETLLAEQHNVFGKHPKTTFINAHMGWYPNNLAKLDSIMAAYPNMMLEIGAVIAELGRQPRAANRFFTKHQDRILFGKDSWVPSEYPTYFRVLETDDEYFPYHKKYHAFWRMYGMALSDQVLKKVYYKNALRIIPGLDKTLFPE